VLSDAQRALATNATTRQLLTLIPQANATGPGGSPRFLGAATAPVNINQETIDINHSIGQSDRLHGYYAVQRDLRGEPILQGNSIPGFGDTRQSRRQIFTFN
jgi:hypothetical protein